MKLEATWDQPDRLLLTFDGTIDWTARDRLHHDVGELLEGKPDPQVLIDMEAVDFVNSAGIGALLQVAQLVESRGGRIAMACLPPKLQQLFEAVGLERAIPMHETLEAARGALVAAS